MTKTLYDALARVFHEPHRLAIMSMLCGGSQGQSFNDLKRKCELTDGNLSRHLKTLEEAGAIRVAKQFVGVRPNTTVQVTELGRESFIHYLQALEEVLKTAVESVAPAHGSAPASILSWAGSTRPDAAAGTITEITA